MKQDRHNAILTVFHSTIRHMNHLCILLLLGLSACSEKTTPSNRAGGKSAPLARRYAVTFAAVKIPDSTLAKLGLPAYGAGTTIESRRKLADYVATHPADVSITAATGNIVPIVWNNERCEVKFLLDAKQEANDLEKFGMATTQFVPSVSVSKDDGKGTAYCDWYCNCTVHLGEPVGNSTDHGRGGGCGGGLVTIGKPEIWPLLQGKGVSLWMFSKLEGH
jgi:hypothetical protein